MIHSLNLIIVSCIQLIVMLLKVVDPAKPKNTSGATTVGVDSTKAQQSEEEYSQLLEEMRDENAWLTEEVTRLRRQNESLVQEKKQVVARIAPLEQENRQLCEEVAQKESTMQQQRAQTIRREHEFQREIQNQAARLNRTHQDQLRQLQREMEWLQLALLQQVSSESFEFWKTPRDSVHIHGEIASGAWGAVARATFRGKTVAVKWPHSELLSEPAIVERLKREVQIMAQVRHPNLVLFIAAVIDEAAENLQCPPLIITELLSTNLRSAYKNRRLDESVKISIFQDVACALNYLHLHHQPIIHRDVSAPNVLLDSLPHNHWRAKLSDFGSANLATVARTAGEGAIIYAAPETFPPNMHDPDAIVPPQTIKIDVYSYGVLLCEVITNQMPITEEYRGMLQRVESQWPLMHSIILSCTKRRAEERPTMAGVLEELSKTVQL